MNSSFNNIDPEDIKYENPNSRIYKRKRLIKDFLKWKLVYNRNIELNMNEDLVINKHALYFKMLCLFGLCFDIALYRTFFIGIYSYRTYEIIDFHRISRFIKIPISTILTYFICKKLWNDRIYDSDLYSLALKYRNRYDKFVIKEHNI